MRACARQALLALIGCLLATEGLGRIVLAGRRGDRSQALPAQRSVLSRTTGST